METKLVDAEKLKKAYSVMEGFQKTGEKETVEAYHMKGKSHDCGNKLGYMQAFVEYGIRHNTLGTEFKAWLEEEMGIKK